MTILRQTTCWPWVPWWRQSWCGRTASSSTLWTNLLQCNCTVTLILTFLQCLETDLWLLNVEFFGNLPPGFSMPSLPWRYISFVGVLSRTSTSGMVASLYLSKKKSRKFDWSFEAWGRPLGFWELRGSCRIVPGLADWLLGCNRGNFYSCKGWSISVFNRPSASLSQFFD